MRKKLLLLILCFTMLLCGCSSNKDVEPTNTINIKTCMSNVGARPSVQGESLTYYYSTADEISLYYVSNWRKGIVSWKRFFLNEEQYNLQKSIYPNAICKDKELTILIKEYMVVEDVAAHWSAIESAGIYTIVK